MFGVFVLLESTYVKIQPFTNNIFNYLLWKFGFLTIITTHGKFYRSFSENYECMAFFEYMKYTHTFVNSSTKCIVN